MCAITATRPDIRYAIAVLGQYYHDLSNEHMVTPRCVFRYLNGTKDWRLRVAGTLRAALRAALGDRPIKGSGELGCHVHSDYPGCLHDYQGTSGLVITIGGVGAWRSGKHKSSAQSTTYDEYYAFVVG